MLKYAQIYLNIFLSGGHESVPGEAGGRVGAQTTLPKRCHNKLTVIYLFIVS
jgi:hypothetical protein